MEQPGRSDLKKVLEIWLMMVMRLMMVMTAMKGKIEMTIRKVWMFLQVI